MDELYLRRKIDGFLMKWKETTDHNPLIVKGPPGWKNRVDSAFCNGKL